MLTISEALRLSLETVPPVQPIDLPLREAHGRVLAEDVIAPSPIPPWDNSAMDGFALRAQDTHSARPIDQSVDTCLQTVTDPSDGPWLKVTETIAAGSIGEHTVGNGQAARIMTGAPIPRGADAVVMVEHTRAENGTVQVHTRVQTGAHIRRAGSDVAGGSLVLSRGQTLTPAVVGLAAAVGRAQVTVARQIRVGIVATGSELVLGGSPLGPGQIYSANTAALTGWVLAAGAIPVDCGIADDTLAETTAAFSRAIQCDLVISTGGVSAGDFDLVKAAMVGMGAHMQFMGIKMKPGKPLALGVIGGTPAFGLPGNPVAAQVGFLQFVRPWIRSAMGCTSPFLPVIQARLSATHTKKAGRAELSRVRLRWESECWSVLPNQNQSSGSPRSLADADGLMLLNESAHDLQPGEWVHVQLIGSTHRGQAEPGYPW
jgi:molybdopterin molybdotransferase